MRKAGEVVKEFDKEVGRNIRKIRECAGITAEDAADILDISYQQFGKYERGQNRISPAHLMKLSNALDVHISRFFDYDEKHSVNDDIFSRDPGLSKLIRYYLKIKDSNTRSKVVNIVKSLAD